MALSEIADVLNCLATCGKQMLACEQSRWRCLKSLTCSNVLQHVAKKNAVQNSGRESDDVVAIAVQFECDVLVLRGQWHTHADLCLVFWRAPRAVSVTSHLANANASSRGYVRAHATCLELRGRQREKHEPGNTHAKLQEGLAMAQRWLTLAIVWARPPSLGHRWAIAWPWSSDGSPCPLSVHGYVIAWPLAQRWSWPSLGHCADAHGPRLAMTQRWLTLAIAWSWPLPDHGPLMPMSIA